MCIGIVSLGLASARSPVQAIHPYHEACFVRAYRKREHDKGSICPHYCRPHEGARNHAPILPLLIAFVSQHMALPVGWHAYGTLMEGVPGKPLEAS